MRLMSGDGMRPLLHHRSTPDRWRHGNRLFPFDWERLIVGLQPPLYLLEGALKCVVIFCLLLVMRLLGKRGQNHLSQCSRCC